MSTLGDRPAFPVPASGVANGVCLRDWFAAMALQGVVGKGLEVVGDRMVTQAERNEMMARRAYDLADAMLAISIEATTAAAAT